ncbi:MAG TPA: hypothetical protein VJS67_06080 [Pseudonocardiaceae bacterium]|nr:hypothetical protein [Pseudonocardiaceae bacterium]
MAVTVTTLGTRRRGTGTVGAPKIKGNASTLRAYAGVLDRVADTAVDCTHIAQLDGASVGEHRRRQGRIALPGQLVVARRRL